VIVEGEDKGLVALQLGLLLEFVELATLEELETTGNIVFGIVIDKF
jgi:hypothetical protein